MKKTSICILALSSVLFCAPALSLSYERNIKNDTDKPWTLERRSVGKGNMYINGCALKGVGDRCPILPGDNQVKITSTDGDSYGWVRLFMPDGKTYPAVPHSAGNFFYLKGELGRDTGWENCVQVNPHQAPMLWIQKDTLDDNHICYRGF